MNKLIIRTKGKTYYINVDTVIYATACRAYTCIYLINGDVITASFNLLALQTKLSHCDFIFRTGRSHLINLRHLTCIDHLNKQIVLGEDIKISYTIALKDIEKRLNVLKDRITG